jgi:hypothetical protein
VLRYGLIYFVAVFSAGFLLAPVRELILVPRLGQMWAELTEMPVMFLVMFLAAGWVARRPVLQHRLSTLLGIGMIALALMLLGELGVVYFVNRISLQTYIDQREPVSGVVYLLMLLVFALLPWWRGKAGRGQGGSFS